MSGEYAAAGLLWRVLEDGPAAVLAGAFQDGGHQGGGVRGQGSALACRRPDDRRPSIGSLAMHIATRGGVLAAVGLAAVFLTAVTGCSSDPGQDDSESELLRGLAILADSNSANQVTCLNVAHAQKLSKEDKERFGVIGLPGTSLWTGYEPGPWGQSVSDRLGFPG
ncbi:hypothetical protein [Streptomyces sp. HC307]|uniref:hypothetical protein n=1 Tax=Streptomyces flavusporus TaxID=3385496 RepID=UPI00391735C8